MLVQRQNLRRDRPLFHHVLQTPSISWWSQILIEHDLPDSHKKEFRQQAIVQMPSTYQNIIGNINSFNTSDSFNIVNFNTEIELEEREILRWLSPLEPHQRHQGVRAHRLDGVGNWVLETSEFRKWCGTEDGGIESVMFLYGNPGVGKTYVR